MEMFVRVSVMLFFEGEAILAVRVDNQRDVGTGQHFRGKAGKLSFIVFLI